MESKLPRIITHSGSFQPDDVCAVATLSLLLGGRFELVRTRLPELFKTGDYVVDVGEEDNPDTNRFDHHQKGGAGVRPNGIPYAAFGLVWKKYGATVSKSGAVSDYIEKTIVEAVDADDVGMRPTKADSSVPAFLFVDALYSFVPTWNESDDMFDSQFTKAVEVARQVLEREIIKREAFLEAERSVEKAYSEAKDKRIIVLDRPYPSTEVLTRYPEPLFVVKPGRQKNYWKVKAVNTALDTVQNRALFPESWAAKRGEALQSVSGVQDADFCHKDRWVGAALSKEGAIRMAEIAVTS